MQESPKKIRKVLWRALMSFGPKGEFFTCDAYAERDPELKVVKRCAVGAINKATKSFSLSSSTQNFLLGVVNSRRKGEKWASVENWNDGVRRFSKVKQGFIRAIKVANKNAASV